MECWNLQRFLGTGSWVILGLAKSVEGYAGIVSPTTAAPKRQQSGMRWLVTLPLYVGLLLHVSKCDGRTGWCLGIL